MSDYNLDTFTPYELKVLLHNALTETDGSDSDMEFIKAVCNEIAKREKEIRREK